MTRGGKIQTDDSILQEGGRGWGGLTISGTITFFNKLNQTHDEKKNMTTQYIAKAASLLKA